MAAPRKCGKCGEVHDVRLCVGHTSRCTVCEHRRGNRTGEPCMSCEGGPVVDWPCSRWPIRGGSVCPSHGGSSPTVKAAGRRRADKAEAVQAVERFRSRLGVEAVDEPLEDTALREIRKARSDLAMWQACVDQLVDATDGDLLGALAVHTGNKQKPNEVDKHFALARRDEERDRLMQWIATARKLGIEQAAIEQAERLSSSQGERLVVVLKQVVDDLRAALLAAGASREVIDATFKEQLGPIVRAAIEASQDPGEAPA